MNKNKKENNYYQLFIKYWLPVILWSVVIFLFSSLPTAKASQIDWRDFIVKKSAHIIEYAIFATLIYRALKESGTDKKKAGMAAVLISVMYGFSDEFHQSLTPGRDPKIRDVFFDTIGSLLAIYSIWKLLPKAPRKLKAWAHKLQIL